MVNRIADARQQVGGFRVLTPNRGKLDDVYLRLSNRANSDRHHKVLLDAFGFEGRDGLTEKLIQIEILVWLLRFARN